MLGVRRKEWMHGRKPSKLSHICPTRSRVRHVAFQPVGAGVELMLLGSDEVPDVVISGAAILGWVGCTICYSLWSWEQQIRKALEVELALERSKLDDERANLAKIQVELERERKASKDAEMYKRRLGESSKEVMKLEKSLEIKDGQQEAFMVVAHRQIKYLEESLKEARKVPAP